MRSFDERVRIRFMPVAPFSTSEGNIESQVEGKDAPSYEEVPWRVKLEDPTMLERCEW
jgi:hypothetical protein